MAVLRAEPQIIIDACAYIVTIEQNRMAAKRVQAIIATDVLAGTVKALEDGTRDIYSVQQEIEQRLFK